MAQSQINCPIWSHCAVGRAVASSVRCLPFDSHTFSVPLTLEHLQKSSPSILPPRVRVSGTPSMLLSIYILSCGKDENKQKKAAGIDPCLKLWRICNERHPGIICLLSEVNVWLTSCFISLISAALLKSNEQHIQTSQSKNCCIFQLV